MANTANTSSTEAESLDAKVTNEKIFVFDWAGDWDARDLMRGGLNPENLLACQEDYAKATQAVRDYDGKIPVAVIDIHLYPPNEAFPERSEFKDGEDYFAARRKIRRGHKEKITAAYQELERALKENNPEVKIYHVMCVTEIETLSEMARLGLIEMKIDGMIGAMHGGSAEENPFCRLGKQLQEEYFS